MTRKPVAVLIGFLAFIVVSCSPAEAEPEQSASAPRLGNIVPYGNPISREIDTTIETVPNCLGNDHSKLPSRSASSTHSVEWRSGDTTGMGLTIGEGVVPGGVNLEAAFSNTFGQSFMDQLTYTEGWELFAHEGMVNTITLLWHEDWQPAYLDVVFADGRIERIELSYRTRIFSTLVKEEETPCDTSASVTRSTKSEEESVAETSPPEATATFVPQPTNSPLPTIAPLVTNTASTSLLPRIKGHETVQEGGTRILSLVENEAIIGTADRFQDVFNEDRPPFTIFVVEGPAETDLTIWWGGWDVWENASSEHIDSEIEKKIQEVKQNHPEDHITRGYRVMHCARSISSCEIVLTYP